MPCRRIRPLTATCLLLVALNSASIGCAFSVVRDPPPRSQAADVADDQNEEEVLDQADDVFAESPKRASGTAGELLVAVGYVGMMLAATVLPLLLLF